MKKIVLRRHDPEDINTDDLLSTYVESSDARNWRWMLREVRAMAALREHDNVIRYHQSWLEVGDIPSASDCHSESGSGTSMSGFSFSCSSSGAEAGGGKARLLCIQMELCEGQTLRQLLDMRDAAAASHGSDGSTAS